jgi:hypothetical protein
MIVVPVLTTSCQVSLKPKSGPVTSHRRMIAADRANATGCPAARADFLRLDHMPEARGRAGSSRVTASSEKQKSGSAKQHSSGNASGNDGQWLLRTKLLYGLFQD